MAEIFGNDRRIRGCFAVYQIDARNSRGAQLIVPGYGKLPKSSYSEPLLVIGFQASISESVLYNKCFGNRVYTYAFGHDPYKSTLAVNFIGFLIEENSYSGVVEDFRKAYEKGRVSESKDYAELLLGSSRPLEGFIVGFQTQTLDPQHSLQQFTMLLDVPKLD